MLALAFSIVSVAHQAQAQDAKGLCTCSCETLVTSQTGFKWVATFDSNTCTTPKVITGLSKDGSCSQFEDACSGYITSVNASKKNPSHITTSCIAAVPGATVGSGNVISAKVSSSRYFCSYQATTVSTPLSTDTNTVTIY